MGIEEILKLIQSVQDTDIQELEVSNGDWNVRIARSSGGVVSVQPVNVVPATTGAPVPAAPATSEPADEAEKNGYVEVTSPIVGTFYRAPEPGADPFVNENDVVAPGQIMCIIEAMKLNNEIPSEIKGRIVEILVENAQPVQYGQVLFLLEPM